MTAFAELDAQNPAEGCSQRHKSHEFSANFLDKIRNVRYVFRSPESLSRSQTREREDEKPWLFENLGLQPTARAGAQGEFFLFELVVTH